MLGYIRYGDGPKRPEAGLLRLPAGTMAVLTLREERRPMALTARRRAMRGAELLLDQGVRRAVFPLDFPYTAAFIRRGICPVETLPLERRLAASAVRRRLDGLGLDRTRASAAVSARRAGPVCDGYRPGSGTELPVCAAVDPGGGERLCPAAAPGVRRVHSDGAGSGAAGPGRRPYAVCSQGGPGAEKPGALYAVPRRRRPGAGLRPPAAIREWADPNCDMGQLAAALHSLGAVTAEQLLAEIPC